MPPTINIAAYSDALVVLGTAGILVPIISRLGFSPTLGYLVAGAILGPLGLGSFIRSFPWLYWFTVGDAKNVAGIAELGVVFLLFLIGLELSLHRLLTMRRYVFGLGGLQVLLTTGLIAGVAAATGQKPADALILGSSLSLSSTAIVLELLSKQERLTTSVGRTSFSVLLAQDLAVIPILMFVSILAGGPGKSVLTSLASALVSAVIALSVIVVFGRVLLRPLFRLVATTRSRDLFIATVLFVIVGAGVVANQAGLSMALGAFVAGLLLAETEYRKAIEATVAPVKALLLGIFFFTVGMEIDYRELLRQPLLLIGAVAALIAAKSLILMGLGRLFRLSWPVAVETGLLLGPGGEFAFVGIGMAAAASLIDARVASFVLAATSVTMLLTPRAFRCRPALCLAAQVERRRGRRADRPSGRRTEPRNRRRLWPRRQGRMRAAQGAWHRLYRSRFGRPRRHPRPPRRTRCLLRRRRRPALPRSLRAFRRGRRHHHDPHPERHRRCRHARALDAARYSHRLAGAGCRACQPSLQPWGNRCRP